MRKTILFLFIATLAWQCSSGPSRKELQDENERLFQASLQKDIELNNMLKTLSDIDDNIRQITHLEQIISNEVQSGDIQGRSKEAINADLSNIYQLILDNKQKVEALERNLKAAGIQSRESQRLIENLNQQIIEKNQEIIVLRETLIQRELQIDELNMEVIALSLEIDSLSKTALRSEEELQKTSDKYNRVWYAIGTRRELRDRNILTREGFLFFGSQRLLKDDFDHSYFNEIDRREADIIPLHEQKIKILSNHPEDSYHILTDENGLKSISVDDKDRFWSISRYLIIQAN